jgi:uncharacterized protein
MSSKEYTLHSGKKGAALAIRLTPRASKNEISAILDDGTVKIRLTAPPTEDQANDALVAFLAEVLEVPPSRIEIVAGTTGRDKLVSIVDLDSAAVHQKILNHLA